MHYDVGIQTLCQETFPGKYPLGTMHLGWLTQQRCKGLVMLIHALYKIDIPLLFSKQTLLQNRLISSS